jgi:periplasmic divalent cation tolerance protein
MDNIVVLITASKEEEAVVIAKTLVEERLAACVNIVPAVRSIYRWEGKVHDDPECMMVVKTSASNFELLESRVKALHSYSVPEIIALPIVKGYAPYLEWLTESTLLG